MMRFYVEWSRIVSFTFVLALSMGGHSAEVTLDIVDFDQKPLADAVVALEPRHNPDFSKPLESTMNQREVRFSPHVLAVRTNTLVHFLNSDPIFHHVYSFSPAKRFELGLSKGEKSDPVLFDEPGRVVLGCNIHDGMLAYIYVLDTEWFGVTGINGRVKLTRLPAGEYELVVHHPRLRKPARESLVLSQEDEVSRRFMLPELLTDPRRPRGRNKSDEVVSLKNRQSH